MMGAIPGSAMVHNVYHVVTFKLYSSDNFAKSYSEIVLVLIWLLSEQVF